MTQTKFLEDIQKLYDFISTQKNEINKLYEYLEKNEDEKLEIITKFAQSLNLTLNNDLKLALLTRLVNLRDDSLVQVLKKAGYNDNQIINLQEQAYQFVKEYWLNIQHQRVDFISQENLLTPFYREIFKGVYSVGVAMSIWQSSWTQLIINGENKELLEKFDNNDEKVMEFLEENNLFDKGNS